MPKSNIFNKLLVYMNLKEPTPLMREEIFAPRNADLERERRMREHEMMLDMVLRQQRQRMFGVNARPARAAMIQKSKREKDI